MATVNYLLHVHTHTQKHIFTASQLSRRPQTQQIVVVQNYLLHATYYYHEGHTKAIKLVNFYTRISSIHTDIFYCSLCGDLCLITIIRYLDLSLKDYTFCC